MTIAVSQTSGQAWASGTTVSTTGITTVSGSLLALVYLGYKATTFGGNTATPTDSKSCTWSGLVASELTKTAFAQAWYNVGGSRGASHTATVTLDGTAQASAVLIEITGYKTSGSTDASNYADSSTGTATVTSSATTNARCLVIGAAITRGNFGTVNWNANGTITGSNGTDIYTDSDGTTHTAGSSVWYRIVSATGAQTASRSHDTGTDWAALVFSIVEAASSPLLLRRRHGLSN